MRAAVHKILAFEEDAGVRAVEGKVSTFGERGWAPELVAEQCSVFGHEGFVGEGVDKRALELVRRRQERFGDELPAEFAVVCGQDGAATVGVISYCLSLGSGSCR